jgi:hypothetical protein
MARNRLVTCPSCIGEYRLRDAPVYRTMDNSFGNSLGREGVVSASEALRFDAEIEESGTPTQETMGDPSAGLKRRGLAGSSERLERLYSPETGVTVAGIKLPWRQAIDLEAFPPHFHAKRFCPNDKCNTQWPKALDYGPVHTIAVVGTTGAGKTNLIAQMVSALTDDQAFSTYGWKGVRVSPETQRLFETEFGDIVEAGAASLATARSPNHMNRAVIVEGSVSGSLEERTAILFVDVPGEVFMSEYVLAQEGRFVYGCDAVLLLIDPEQVPGMARGHDDRRLRQHSFGVHFLELLQSRFRSNLPPIAVCLSKSDAVRERILEEKCEIIEPLRADYESSDGMIDWEKQAELKNFLARREFRLGMLLEYLRGLEDEFGARIPIFAIAPRGAEHPPLKPERVLDPLLALMYELDVIELGNS